MTKITYILLVGLTASCIMASSSTTNNRGQNQKFTPPTFEPALTADEQAMQNAINTASSDSVVADLRAAIVKTKALIDGKFATPEQQERIKKLIGIILFSLPRNEKKWHRKTHQEQQPNSDDDDNNN